MAEKMLSIKKTSFKFDIQIEMGERFREFNMDTLKGIDQIYNTSIQIAFTESDI